MAGRLADKLASFVNGMACFSVLCAHLDRAASWAVVIQTGNAAVEFEGWCIHKARLEQLFKRGAVPWYLLSPNGIIKD